MSDCAWSPSPCRRSTWTTGPASSWAALPSTPPPRRRRSPLSRSGSRPSSPVGTLACHQGAVVDATYGEAVTAPDVSLTKAGLADPICAGVPEVFQAFVAHKEAVTELPPHAVVLGTGRACPVQIFRIKSNLYATQFHPELDGDYLAHRLGFYSGHGYFADGELAELQARVRLDDVSESWKLLANFVSVHARD